MLLDLGLIWVIGWMLKNAAMDVTHAVKGTPNPRYELKKAKAKAAGQAPQRQPRYGGKEWFADLLSDGLEAQTQRRRAKAKAKGQPVDDMVDVVWEPESEAVAPARTRRVADPVPAFRHETPEPPVPPTREEAPVPRRPDHDEDERRTSEQPPRTSWSSVEEQEAAIARLQQTASRVLAERDPAMWKRTHRPADGPTADDVLNGLAGPGGLFAGGVHPKCSWHNTPLRQVDGRMVCPACIHIVPTQPAATDDRPDARIYQFPTIKTIEEITMATSEVTGLSTAIAFAEQTAAVHASFSSAGTENYVAALAQHGVGDGTIGSARDAMEKSAIAAAAWEQHRDDLAAQHTVKEAYQGNPDAGNKDFLLNG